MINPLNYNGNLDTRPLWDYQEAALATNGQSSAPWSCYGVAIDNRDVEQGDLFVDNS